MNNCKRNALSVNNTSISLLTTRVSDKRLNEIFAVSIRVGRNTKVSLLKTYSFIQSVGLNAQRSKVEYIQ